MKASASNDPSMSQKNDVVELLRQGLSGKYSVKEEGSVTSQRNIQIPSSSDQPLTKLGQSSTEPASTEGFITILKGNQPIIKFPASFQQPSTEDAVRYSDFCEDQTAIEAFYLDIFGLSNKGIKFKFSNNEEKSILSFDELSAQSKFHDFFKGQFCELCSVPVGRLLLYRLLIEIFRNQKNDPLNDSTKERDWNKTLKIIESEKPLW